MKQLKYKVFTQGIVQSITELGKLPIPPVQAIRVSRLLRAVEGPSKDYAQVRQNIIDQYYEEDPNVKGQLRVIVPEAGTLEAQVRAMEAEFTELLNTEFDLPAEFDQPIKLNFSKWDANETGKYNLSAASIGVLDATGLIEVS